jgi:RNA polymerase sigma-70 factor (ECF subfamily)
LQWPWTGIRTKGAKKAYQPDAELIEGLRRRDEQAFLNLYDCHQRTVYRFLMHMTGSIAAAEEITQEVFIAILDAMCAGTMTNFDPGKGTLEGYLLGIARNLVREERRRTHRLISLDSVLETPEWNQRLEKFAQENAAWNAAALIVTRSELRLLYRAILELPAHYREVIVLCSLQEKSYQEAATILRCSEGTIASRMNRAKGLLATKLRRSAAEEVNAASI